MAKPALKVVGDPRIEAPKAEMSEADKDALVTRVRDAIQESWEHDRDNREESATDLAYLAGQQWPDAVRREREQSQRPMLTINRLPQFVRQVTNDIRQADLAIKVSPEDDTSDPQMAKIYNGLIRQIQYRSSAGHVFATAAEHQAGCGIGWFRVTTCYTDDTAFDQEIKLKIIQNPLSVYCDPSAVEPDRSDAIWIAAADVIPSKAFKRRYPKAKDVSVDVNRNQALMPLFWASDDYIRIAEYWWKEPVDKTLALLPSGETVDITELGQDTVKFLGPVRTRVCKSHKIKMALVSGAEILEGPFDWPGEHIPLVPVIGGEFPLESKRYRYSVIRFARDAQQLYNFYRTATAEAIALAPKAPYLATEKQIGPYRAMWETAHAKNRPFMLYAPDSQAPGPPKREHPPEMPTALMQEASIASDDMKATTGIYDSALGHRSNETSGIAIQRRQTESDVANFHFVDNLQRSLEHCGRILIDLIPKIYDSERVIRLTGDNGKEEPVRINQQVMSVSGVPMMINDLSSAAFDVRVTIGKGYATKRQETADSMLKFMQTLPESQHVIADLIAENLDFEKHEIIAKRLRNTIPPQVLADPDDPKAPPAPNPMDDPKVQIEMRKAAADAALTEAQVIKTQMEAAALQQQGVQPELTQPEVDPYEAHNQMHGALKSGAEAEHAMHRAELARLNVVGKQRELNAPQPEGDDESAEPQPPGAVGAMGSAAPPQGESMPPL